ncbi:MULTISPECIES: hypothetical protein [Saccharibacillus]|uniref:hypothetical protein n=1 Tax=Saccharibacillus TaxID=456492 RepID=UPI00123ABA24|nr:hypothetical protein [Saccharibacillus sp. WB 17]MWJ33822.1 hypothetical protein [Saccharibacillus sp. WB 17]
MKDYIISYSKRERYAEIDYDRSEQFEHYFCGFVLQNALPERLSWLIRERQELIRQVVLTLLDDVEEEIHTYDLRLEKSGERVFDVSLSGDELTFFTRYAVGDEFLDTYPDDESSARG